jgi:ATP-binding cassette subfamily C (CFTR/MRP) protein 1
VALALIYQQVGVSTFVGLGFMFFLVPLNGRIFLLLNQIRRLKVKVTDTRVKLMNEILSGVRVIKYYAWEIAFQGKITAVREEELYLLKKLAYVVAIGFTLILMSAPIVQPILIFFTYIKLGNTLDAATAFTTISLFNVMQFPFAFLPMGLAQYSQSLVRYINIRIFYYVYL